MNDPEQIGLRYLTENADHHYLSVDRKWMMWVWRNIVLLKPPGRCSAEDTALDVAQCFSLFKKVREKRPKVYYLIARLIWKSNYQLIGMQDRVLLFKDFTEAFAWICGRWVNNGA
jgi:hypothetical protein